MPLADTPVLHDELGLDPSRAAIDFESAALGSGSSAETRRGLYRFAGRPAATEVAFKVRPPCMYSPACVRTHALPANVCMRAKVFRLGGAIDRASRNQVWHARRTASHGIACPCMTQHGIAFHRAVHVLSRTYRAFCSDITHRSDGGACIDA